MLSTTSSPARRPAEPTPTLARLVGQYGAGGQVLDVSERDGELFVDGLNFVATRLEQRGSSWVSASAAPSIAGPVRSSELRFSDEPVAQQVQRDGLAFVRRDLGAEALTHFRSQLEPDAMGLLQNIGGCRPAPVIEGGRRGDGLVQVVDIDSSIRLDIRYAGADNFLGFPVYDRARAYLQRPAALALARVQSTLADVGHGLVVHDAYRPWSATELFWRLTPQPYRMFLADPEFGSNHNRGCAADVTLLDLEAWSVVTMTSRYDEPTARSYCDYPGGTSRQRWSRDLLRQHMQAQGFRVHPHEWWHFDFRDAHLHPVQDVSFSDLDQAA